MTKEKEFDLQDRLVDYAVRIIKLSEVLPETKAGKHAMERRKASKRPGKGNSIIALDIGNSLLDIGY